MRLVNGLNNLQSLRLALHVSGPGQCDQCCSNSLFGYPVRQFRKVFDDSVKVRRRVLPRACPNQKRFCRKLTHQVQLLIQPSKRSIALWSIQTFKLTKRLEDIDAQAQFGGLICDLASGTIETRQIGLVEFNSGKSRICNCF